AAGCWRGESAGAASRLVRRAAGAAGGWCGGRLVRRAIAGVAGAAGAGSHRDERARRLPLIRG
ncbi:hypothetical protein, partial [Nocardia brasiliensis]|uniref:hypothetical protein n=1 Tax=Nocardia brasiliensis TaxID=37326 RepID=UPI0024563F71